MFKYTNNTVCNCYFDSSIAYIIDNIEDTPIKKINISDYLLDDLLKTEISDATKFLVCKNNNELIKYESIKKKSHFKHKNSNGMTEWHKNWQDKFDIIEKHIGNRIADAIVHDNVIEFQHSYISTDEVKQRGIDYLAYNKKLHWVIDCNDSISIYERGDIYLIKFIKDTWKYEHFISNEFIFLNINNRLFKINPSLVKSNMIDVREYKLEDEFIDSFVNNINIWDNSNVIQCILYHNQRGAGCGKTYESIQLLNKNEIFKEKKIFIYLTKMHSAKEVIYNELIEQYKKGVLDNIEIDDIYDDHKSGKQYKLSYLDKITHTQCILIIGTIDSFMWALGNKKIRHNDYFAGIVKSIKDGYVDTSKDGTIKYSLDTIKLNKNCLIIIDEAQDLGPEYIEAVCSIMRNTYIDAYVIGDKLQSIWGEHNIHTFLEHNDLPNINIERNTGINHVMRFHNIQFQDFVNNIIDFKKYNLPEIEKICNLEQCKYKHENEIKPYNIFEVPTIYADETDDDKVEKLVEKIINYMEDEINKYNYLPNNFMFIFPILLRNYLANRLESRLQAFWINKFNNKDYQDNVLATNIYWKNKINENYYKYVYLHKSDEGKSINLKESENATRILSIHASKGNGSEVVFLFGLTEYALKVFSKDKCNLVYDSLLHVALTRQKKSLYIGIEYNGDDIYNKFNKFDIDKDVNIQPRIEDIKINNKYQNIIDYSVNTNNIFTIIDEQYIKPYNFESLIPKIDDSKNIIEWGHHIIRYYVFLYYIKLNIYNNEIIDSDNNTMKQFITILSKISKLSISSYLHKDYYKYIEENFSTIDKKKNAKEIPILIFIANENSKYNKYKTTITDFIYSIQNKINRSLKKNKLPSLCPLEIVILYYCIKLYDNGIYSDLTIMDIYSIIYCYDECSNSINEQHKIYKCLCKNKFNENNNSNEIYKEMQESIKNHFEKTKQIDKLYSNYKDYLIKNFDNPSKFKYNIFHPVVYGDEHDDFKITNKFDIIAYSDKYVINFIITPQFNKLNFNNIIFNGIMNKYLLLNSCQTHNNFNRYNNKEIITCIFTLDSIQPIFINFNINKNDNIIKDNIKSYLLNEYTCKHNIIYQFYQYCKNNKSTEIKKNSISYTYDEIKKKALSEVLIPEYILNYFYDINKEIDICKEKNQSKKYIEDTILNKVNDQELFLNDINNYLIKSINKFLKINDELIDDNYDF